MSKYRVWVDGDNEEIDGAEYEAQCPVEAAESWVEDNESGHDEDWTLNVRDLATNEVVVLHAEIEREPVITISRMKEPRL